MTTTPAKKNSVCRSRGIVTSPSKSKALRRCGLRSLRCWQHLTRCYNFFHRRTSSSAFSWFRRPRTASVAAVLTLWLPTLAQAANFQVTSNSDITNASDGVTTLREALILTNGSAGPDTIGFIGALAGEVIILTQGELVISEGLSIDASDLANAPIIDAGQNSRVMHFTAPVGDLELTKLTLRNGKTTGDGGGIRFPSSGTLTLTDSTLSGNSTNGYYGNGGGISTSSGAIILTNSTLSGNATNGGYSNGGGISSSSGAINLTSSTVSGNSTSGGESGGGGIHSTTGDITLTNSTVSGNSIGHSYGGGIASDSGDITLINSTLSGNSTSGSPGDGGGIYSGSGATILTNSTLSGNSTSGGNSYGGGISSASGDITLTNSTLCGNSTSGFKSDGGGIFSPSGDISLTNSTLSGNSASNGYSTGGGIYTSLGAVTLTNSIIAGNLDNGTAPDLRAPNDPANQLEVSYSLIGNSTGAGLDEAMVNLNNLIDLDPLLGPLADNGGDTETMAPLQGSPVINAGIANGLTMDQRGFDRIGATDIGAVEYQGPFDLTPAFDSDDDGDGNAYGVEQALGTDPYVSDPANPRNLTAPVLNGNGQPMLSFGISDAAAPGTRWMLERSTNLGAFVEIYCFDGTTHIDFPGFPIDIQPTATGVTITDQDPPVGRAFYRFKTDLAAP